MKSIINDSTSNLSDARTYANELLTSITGISSDRREGQDLDIQEGLRDGAFFALEQVRLAFEPLRFRFTSGRSYVYPVNKPALDMSACLVKGLSANNRAAEQLFAERFFFSRDEASRFLLKDFCEQFLVQAPAHCQPKRPPFSGTTLSMMGYFISTQGNDFTIYPQSPAP